MTAAEAWRALPKLTRDGVHLMLADHQVQHEKAAEQGPKVYRQRQRELVRAFRAAAAVLRAAGRKGGTRGRR